ncbi:MAG: YchF-related putative GTPase [Candidatus Micrarchaeales archaeon]|jgi:ribosome-binding ATPase YchF (GTP1/OBG family)
MLIGIIGAPNKGKTTIFSALTMVEAAIASYPFTTINPNFGIAYITKKCVDRELGVRCNPRNSLCTDGIRQIPVNITDVAGLVPDAHLGKGMGNQFLNDLISASAFVQVVDLSGRTDIHGNPCTGCKPEEEVIAIKKEIALWLSGIIQRHMKSINKRNDGDMALKEILTGFNVSIEQIRKAAELNYLSTSEISWSEEDSYKFADSLIAMSKPTIIAANKLDQSSVGALDDLKSKLKGYTVIGCSGAIELALRKAAERGVIDYIPGSDGFSIKKEVNKEQEDALKYMADFIKKNKGTGVQEIINTVTFGVLDSIVVYPVEDENKYTDHFGNVLPDALLVRKGSNARDMAEMIHTNLAKGMLYAIDARKKLKVSRDYVLKDNDVIKIVSAMK